MTIAYDFKLDDDGDLYIDSAANDLVIAPSDRQHIMDILSSAPGHYKEFPLVGWNPYKRINAKANRLEVNQTAKEQLQSDGYEVRALNIEIDAAGQATLTELDVFRP